MSEKYVGSEEVKIEQEEKQYSSCQQEFWDSQQVRCKQTLDLTCFWESASDKY